MATAADEPYAAPGDTVSMQVLAFDGRPTQPEAMRVWWLPQTCFNPAGDNYYACYPALSQTYQPGIDITPSLSVGEAFSFQLPDDIITSHQGSRGGDPYGLAVVFALACAGHLQYVSPPSGAPPDTVPFGCFDMSGVQLGPDDFIFSYSLVYSFADRTNANPIVQGLTFGGEAVDPVAGITVAHCGQQDVIDCAPSSVDVIVPDSSDEIDPGSLDTNGNPLKEEVYVDYYLTAGRMDHDTVIIFDPRAGRLSRTSDNFYAPQSIGDSWLWAVLHDNRGGVSWLQIPVHSE